MASAMAGVPASKREGGSAYVLPSSRTSWIISPPPIHGGMSASSDDLQQAGAHGWVQQGSRRTCTEQLAATQYKASSQRNNSSS